MAHATTLKPDSSTGQHPTINTTVPPGCPIPFALLSDTGRVRAVNEDSCGTDGGHRAFVVCDGMGGAASGEVASQLARNSFLNSLATSSFSVAPPRARLYEAVRAANQAVYRQAQRSRAQRGMGTTLVSLLAPPVEAGAQPIALVAHVGDSRCYRMRAGALEQLTRDHSLIEEQIQAGLITRADAAASPVRNIITRAIGTYASVEIDITAYPVEPGDIFLLATDGLTGEVSDSEICVLLRALDPCGLSRSDLEDACRSLVDAANAHGGNDNITVLLAAFV